MGRLSASLKLLHNSK